MTVLICNGDIFKTRAQIICNPVNCQARSGAGLALEFKKRFPLSYKDFAWQVKWEGPIPFGTLWFDYGTLEWYGKYNFEGICYFPTKESPEDRYSSLSHIYQGLIGLRQHMIDAVSKSVAIPALGCGLGGLKFDTIVEAVHYVFGCVPNLEVYLYEPN